ncbi:MAG: hypothetical protein IPO92_10840 [Saprospiraceae bacterium]|nr:hypothetical protein [Saprospiraceae bacterium]
MTGSDPAGACNPTSITAPTFEATDNCLASALSVIPTTDGPTGPACARTQTWTANYTDACTNAAVPVSVSYTWVEDVVIPVIAVVTGADPAGACNPTSITAPTFEATDNCLASALSVIPTTAGPTGPACARTQTWTANYTDACTNAAVPVSVSYTWVEDVVIPVIAVVTGADPAGACNPTSITAPTFEATDNCLASALSVIPTTAGPTGPACARPQTWTANYTDACTNAAVPVSVSYTWVEDVVIPVIAVVTGSDPAGACNPTSITAPTFEATDNCLASALSVIPTTAGPTGPACARTQTWTANYTDACTNAAVPVSVSYTWVEDVVIPVIAVVTGADPAGACNPTSITAPTFEATDNCLASALSVIPTTAGPTGPACARTQTWTANYTDACTNAAVPVSVSYTWVEDVVIPVIAVVTGSDPAGACNPTSITAPTFEATDNCLASALSVIPTTAGPTGPACARTQTWTANYTDACTNAAVPVSVTYTWVEDVVIPVIAVVTGSDPAGACNPTSITAPTFEATDNCLASALSVIPTTAGPTGPACARTQTWTANYTDACTNAAVPVSVTYTWVEDVVIPVIAVVTGSDPAGACNPASITAPTFEATDNCLASALSVIPTTAGPTGPACARTQTWTANYTDACTNAAVPVSVSYTWVEDVVIPVIAVVTGSDPAGACNPTSITAPTFEATDNCLASALTVIPTTAGPTGPACARTQTWTANYTDACTNAAVPVSVSYTWVEDVVIPVIAVVTSSDPAGACNPTSITAPTFEATDNCLASALSVIPTTAGPTGPACARTQTWTANYTDACTNAAVPVSVSYTWVEDVVIPVIAVVTSADPAGACNPTSITAPTFEATDNCLASALSVIPTTAGPTGPACARTQTWTANYTDACTNAAVPVSVTYTWVEDVVIPVIAVVTGSDPAGACNPTSITAPTFEATDNCLASALSVIPTTAGPTGPACARTQTWTANYTDACTNAAVPVSVSYTWVEDVYPLQPVRQVRPVQEHKRGQPTIPMPVPMQRYR